MPYRLLYTGALAVLLLFQATAYWAFLQLREASRKRHVAAQLETGVEVGQVHVLHIPKSWEDSYHPHFQHVEQGEVRYHGRMYDIFRIEEHGDTTLYHVIYDREETELFEAAGRDMGLGKTGNKLGLPLLLSLCPAVLNTRCLPPPAMPDWTVPVPSRTTALPENQWGLGPPTPPPESFC